MVASRSVRFVEAPLKLDVAGADLLAALARCLAPDSFSAASRSVYRQWGDEHNSLASATLRAGFDLYLQALDLPAGCEVLFSAITHPDMVEVVRHLGLVPVPVDIVAATMAPSLEALRRAITPRARVMVVAHLFGGHFDLTEILALCRAHGVRLVEDCAQTFGSGYAGHPEADATLFSFGPLKTRTALQGGLMSIRDPALRSRMAEIQAAYPRQPRRSFAARILKFALILALSNDGRRWGRVCSLIERTGRQPHQVVRAWGRSMAGGFCIDRLRVRPSTPSLRLLARRLRSGDPTGWTRRRGEVGEKLARRLVGLERPGALGRDHTHWLFPVMVDDPATMLERLFEDGFQAMPGLSNLITFEPPTDRAELAPREARRILDGVIMLPIHPTLHDSVLDRMARLIAETQEHVRPAAALG